MSRYRRPAEDPNAWLLEGIDKYLAPTDPHNERYVSQSKYTGGDYRQITAQEKDLYAGKITRIDLVTTEFGQVKRCWQAGWMPGDKAHQVGPLSKDWDIDSAAAKLEQDGWTVRRWPGGARAWRIKARPVRTGEYANRFRERLLANPPQALAGRITSYDKYLDL